MRGGGGTAARHQANPMYSSEPLAAYQQQPASHPFPEYDELIQTLESEPEWNRRNEEQVAELWNALGVVVPASAALASIANGHERLVAALALALGLSRLGLGLGASLGLARGGGRFGHGNTFCSQH